MPIQPEKNILGEQNEITERKLSDKIEDLLEESVPRNHKHKKWTEELEKESLGINDLKKILSEIENYLREIKKNQKISFNNFRKKKVFFEFFGKLDENLKQETIKKIEAVVEEALNGHLETIGKGKSAQVFISKKYPEYCYKIITDPKVYEQNSDVQEEAEFLTEMLKIKTDVRVPHPYYYYMDENIHILVMENLNAVTLKDIEEGREHLPEKFDLENAIKNLEEFFKKMHKDLKLHHRDLHNENVMIDQNGKLCIIDPGKAKKQFFDEDVYRGINKVLGTRDIYIIDEIAVKNIISSLKTINKRR